MGALFHLPAVLTYFGRSVLNLSRFRAMPLPSFVEVTFDGFVYSRSDQTFDIVGAPSRMTIPPSSTTRQTYLSGRNVSLDDIPIWVRDPVSHFAKMYPMPPPPPHAINAFTLYYTAHAHTHTHTHCSSLSREEPTRTHARAHAPLTRACRCHLELDNVACV